MFSLRNEAVRCCESLEFFKGIPGMQSMRRARLSMFFSVQPGSFVNICENLAGIPENPKRVLSIFRSFESHFEVFFLISNILNCR